MLIFDLFFFTTEHFIIAIRIKRRVDIDKVNASIGEFFQLVKVIAAINDPGVD